MKFPTHHVIITCLLSLSFIGIIGCKSNPTEPNSTNIVTGTSVDLTTQSVSPSGGTIAIDKPGDSLDGLVISVPNGAYSNARSFHVSYAPITHHEFGSDFNVLTPLITISNGGGYGDMPVTLRIPVHVPKGYFAMGFLYDERSGELEGMPLLESDSDHVLIMTANFEHSTLSTLGKRSGIADDGGSSKIVVAATPETSLTGDIPTGFQPKVDDWQLGDHPTITNPKGISYGEAFTSIWYYVVRKKREGAPSLFGRYEGDGTHKTPNFWQDDVNALKLCSMASGNESINPLLVWSLDLFHQWARQKPMLEALAFSIRKTGNPQFMLAAGSTDRRLLIAYKVSGNTVYVADPAFPGDAGRIITFDATIGAFQPYQGGSATFTEFYYEGLSSVENWTVPADRWKEFDNGTIGNGSFPQYTLMARDSTGKDVPLVDGFKVAGSQLTLSVNGVGFAGTFDLYNEQGTKFAKSGSTVTLPTGKQTIGVHVMDNKSNWVGFKWVSVESYSSGSGSHGGPSSGVAAVQVFVDGQQQPIDTAFFNTYFDTDGERLELEGTNDNPEASCRIDVFRFKGEGSYSLDVPGYITASGYDHDVWFQRGSGVVNITKYRNDSLVGNFSFGAYRISDTTTAITVSGNFSYPK
jgi:hypothetical protein